MIYGVIAVLVLLCLVLAGSGRNQNRKVEQKCRALVDKQKQLEQQLQAAKAAAGQYSQKRAELWQTLNTVHLYASLAQEAETTQEIKENLKLITKECEQAMRRM